MSQQSGPVRQPAPHLPQPPHPARAAFDAVIFDLDGVVTDTAAVHARAWKALFDETLPGLTSSPVPPFEIGSDYRRYVDGRAREDGIRAFLASRGIEPTHGRATIKALAARKQELFARELAVGGVHAFPGTLALLHRLREQGLPVAVVTSSRNSGAVLAAAHLAGLFDVTVDGADALRMRLAGEPDLATEGMREALCTLGERTVENMHLVNTPDWLSLGAGGRRGLVRRQPQPAGHLPAGTGPAARRADPRHPLSRRKEARTRVLSDKLPLEASRNLHTSDAGWVAHEFELQLAPGIRFG